MKLWAVMHITVVAVAVWAFRSMDINSNAMLEGAVMPLTFWLSLIYFLVVAAVLVGRAIGGKSSGADGSPTNAALSDMASPGGGSEGGSGGDGGDN